MKKEIEYLNQKIINCNKCDRLVKFRNQIATKKRKQYIEEKYWGKGVPGFGSYKAKLLIVGLAPAAHGANRTGRVFTGDKSADFLFKCLHSAKISNIERSDYKNDNLKLNDTYITLALKCVPPEDKPKSEELKNCISFFKQELFYLKNLKVILALGKIAFDSCISLFNLKKKNYIFKHSNFYSISKKITLVACYHPSPRNVNTKKIDFKEMKRVLNEIKKFIDHIK